MATKTDTGTDSYRALKLLFNHSKLDGEIIVTRSKFAVAYHAPAAQWPQLAKAVTGRNGLYLKLATYDYAAIAKREAESDTSAVGAKSELRSVVTFCADIDVASKGENYPTRDAALAALDRMPVPPSMIVNSGGPAGGLHAYWPLDVPYVVKSMDDLNRITAISKRWQGHLRSLLAPDSLDATAGPERLIRLPGSIRDGGIKVSIHSIRPECRYSLAQLTIPESREELLEQCLRDADRLLRQLRRLLNPQPSPIARYVDQQGITVEELLIDAGYEELANGWCRPGSTTGQRSLALATKHERPGINVFSTADPLFPSNDTNGKFYSIDEVFIRTRFAGNRKAAQAFCEFEVSQ